MLLVPLRPPETGPLFFSGLCCFIVRDADGQQLAYVYYESEPGRRSAAKPLSKDEARRIAANIAIAKLPEIFVRRLSQPAKLCCNPVPIRPQTLCINRVSVLVSFSGSGKRGRFFAQLARAGSRVAERSL